MNNDDSPQAALDESSSRPQFSLVTMLVVPTVLAIFLALWKVLGVAGIVCAIAGVAIVAIARRGVNSRNGCVFGALVGSVLGLVVGALVLLSLFWEYVKSIDYADYEPVTFLIVGGCSARALELVRQYTNATSVEIGR